MIRRNEGETWLEAVLRLARPHGLEAQVREHYERGRLLGVSEEEAALHAAIDWGVDEGAYRITPEGGYAEADA